MSRKFLLSIKASRTPGLAAATLICMVALVVPHAAAASTFTYEFRSEPLTCDNAFACENDVPSFLHDFEISDKVLAPLHARFTIDEDLVPGGTLVDAMVSWSDDVPIELPEWLVFNSNYGGLEISDCCSFFSIKTDSERSIVSITVFTLSFGGVPYEYGFSFAGGGLGGGVSSGCEEDRDVPDCYIYAGAGFLFHIAPVPLPPALLPFLAGLTLLGSGAILRGRRPRRS